jgi:hypothetical protein
MAFAVKKRRGEEDAIMRRPFGNLEDAGSIRVREAVAALKSARAAEYIAWFKEENQRGMDEDRRLKVAKAAAQRAEQAASKG